MRLIPVSSAIGLILCSGPVATQDVQLSAKQRTGRQAAQVSAEDRQFWAFRPLRKVVPPRPVTRGGRGIQSTVSSAPPRNDTV